MELAALAHLPQRILHRALHLSPHLVGRANQLHREHTNARRLVRYSRKPANQLRVEVQPRKGSRCLVHYEGGVDETRRLARVGQQLLRHFLTDHVECGGGSHVLFVTAHGGVVEPNHGVVGVDGWASLGMGVQQPPRVAHHRARLIPPGAVAQRQRGQHAGQELVLVHCCSHSAGALHTDDWIQFASVDWHGLALWQELQRVQKKGIRAVFAPRPPQTQPQRLRRARHRLRVLEVLLAIGPASQRGCHHVTRHRDFAIALPSRPLLLLERGGIQAAGHPPLGQRGGAASRH
mmetsp:Transcript_26457/g.49940  ORF Transcript_26457/g.49940 Transcript_26457/m.49940 type:complete len:291 (-) Transcript_26457:164-1036(-)